MSAVEVARRRTSLPVARRAFADRRWTIIGWAVGLTILVIVQIAVYPTIRDQPGLSDIWRNAPDAVKALFGFGGEFDLSSGPGYLRAEIFGFTLPLLFLIYAMGAGAGAIAGDEEHGTLGLVLAQPVQRSRRCAGAVRHSGRHHGPARRCCLWSDSAYVARRRTQHRPRGDLVGDGRGRAAGALVRHPRPRRRVCNGSPRRSPQRGSRRGGVRLSRRFARCPHRLAAAAAAALALPLGQSESAHPRTRRCGACLASHRHRAACRHERPALRAKRRHTVTTGRREPFLWAC